MDFQVFKVQLGPDKLAPFRYRLEFSKNYIKKVHLCILKGFRTAAHQSWHIFRVVLESNPGRAGYIDFVGLGSIPRRREVCANFDELEKNW